jgi:multidrug resistance protein MdtO
MALNADKPLGLRSIWELVIEPSRERFAFALRLAIICTLVAIVAEVYQTPEVALTVYVVFFLNKPDRVSSLLLAVVFPIVLTLTISLLLILAMHVLDNPGLRVLAMALVSFFMMFLASASKLKPLASTITLIVAYALDVLGSAPFGEAATRALLYAWLFVGIPALVSVAVNIFFAPSPTIAVLHELSERLHAAADAMKTGTLESIRKLGDLVREGDSELQENLKLTGMEKSIPVETLEALKGASDCVVTVLTSIHLMLNEPEAMPSKPVVRMIAQRLEELASIFEAGGYAARVEPITSDNQCGPLATAAIDFLNTGLVHFGEPRPEATGHQSEAKSGFLVADAISNPIYLQFAIKTTLAAMFCYLTYSVLNWPGIHTALITCFIVSLGTAAETVEKLALRIVGCLIGAGLGLLVLIRIIPLVTGIGGLAVVVFAGAFLAAWIGAGSKHISYAGFQIAFAYFLCVIQGPHPSFDMVLARDRVIGILFGNAVSYFVATQVWPVSVGPSIDKAIRNLKQSMKDIVGAEDSWSRRRLAAEAQGMLHETASNLRLVLYEPASVRPASLWLERRRVAVQRARDLEPSLLAAAELAPSSIRAKILECFRDERQQSGAARNLEQSKTPFKALEALMISRFASLQAALLNLNQAEEHE